jgi:hypothetical protein
MALKFFVTKKFFKFSTKEFSNSSFSLVLWNTNIGNSFIVGILNTFIVGIDGFLWMERFQIS